MKLLSSRKPTLQPVAMLPFQQSCGLAYPVFHTLGSAMCMQEACKWQRKPMCMKTKCLRPGEFTQCIAINPLSQIFLSSSAITVPIRCNFTVKLSKRVKRTL